MNNQIIKNMKRFAMHYPDYEKRNFTLNKMCYNAATYNIIAVGSYWRYLPTYQKGGIYFAVNSVFSNTSPQACVEELAVTHESTTRHISSISGIYAITTGYESDVRTSICSSSLEINLGCPRNISPDGSKK